MDTNAAFRQEAAHNAELLDAYYKSDNEAEARRVRINDLAGEIYQQKMQSLAVAEPVTTRDGGVKYYTSILQDALQEMSGAEFVALGKFLIDGNTELAGIRLKSMVTDEIRRQARNEAEYQVDSE